MAGQHFGGLNSIYILWSNQLGNQSNQSHEKYSWNFYSRLDLSLWIIFFCSCVLGEGLDEGMDILHEMILSNRRRRRQNASNHIGPPKPQRRKVRRSQSTYHWGSTVVPKSFWNCIWIFDRKLIVVVLQIPFHLSRQNASNHIGPPKPQRRKVRRSQSTYHWQVLHNGVKKN